MPQCNTKRPDRVNKHGVNTTYFQKRLQKMVKNLTDYKAGELARDLAKMAYHADKQIAITTIDAKQIEDADYHGT